METLRSGRKPKRFRCAGIVKHVGLVAVFEGKKRNAAGRARPSGAEPQAWTGGGEAGRRDGRGERRVRETAIVATDYTRTFELLVTRPLTSFADSP